ncbi:hypothetical protein BCR33DRAFT_713676 [Rhizoclosmatium globosum]|uniref:Uncharacterized protein n=1 Tax=Rhizoclosmatium globosum TaxID=329046 RepID=A0A1Y2CQT2_9FUNG|nr:hypothetical protein BCR33DRAFT_713676 [Rhizoclosmatium globosum]|eukprot:ORY49306.1 hypothetical protein BCR33DRAFT_713676 [Rhizoclosmatium globosum]
MAPIPESRYWLYAVILSGIYYKLEVLLPFIIGSFCLVNDTFYLIVISLGAAGNKASSVTPDSKDSKPANYGYVTYTLYEPLMVGSFNAVGAFLAKQVGLEGPSRFFLTWGLCHCIVMPMVILGGFYKFTKVSEWILYFLKQVCVYGFAIFILCQNIEHAVLKELVLD